MNKLKELFSGKPASDSQGQGTSQTTTGGVVEETTPVTSEQYTEPVAPVMDSSQQTDSSDQQADSQSGENMVEEGGMES